MKDMTITGGAGLKALRLTKDISQRALARLLGVSATFVGQIEKGTAVPNLTMVQKIADALNESPDALFTLWRLVDPAVVDKLVDLPSTRKVLQHTDTATKRAHLEGVVEQTSEDYE